jgi:hypothetical protein
MKNAHSPLKAVASSAATVLLAAAVLVSLSAPPASAQITTAGVIFLTIEPGARNAGIGGAGEALGADAGPTASFYNPAALALIGGTSFTGMHNKALPELADDLYYEFLGGTHSLGAAGGLGWNITYYNYGRWERTDGVGNVLGSEQSFDLAATTSYGVAINPRIAVGGSFKVVYSSLSSAGAEAERGDGRAFTFAVDGGVLFTDIRPRLNLGIALQNIGPDIVYVDRDQASSLPQNLRVGLAWRAIEGPGQRLTFVYDFYKLLASSEGSFLTSFMTGWSDDDFDLEMRQIVHMGGAEFLLADLIALRAGYFWDQAGVVEYPTFGLGIYYGNYRFDLSHAYAPDKPYSQGTRVSFSLVF